MPRRWELVLEIDRTLSVPPSLQIARALAADIQRGRRRPGDRLPGSRQLAVSLRVHRNTVLAALAELIAEGWVETAPARGTFVTRTIPNGRNRPFSRRLGIRTAVPKSTPLALAEVLAAYRRPSLPRGTLNLSSGAPDMRLVPVTAIGRAPARGGTEEREPAGVRRSGRASGVARGGRGHAGEHARAGGHGGRLHGLVAYVVSQRTPEIGLRLAIGADARDVQWMILRQAGTLGVAGALGGLALAALLRLFATRLLEGVSFSPTAAAASGVLIISVALLAAWGPARRAARIEPSVTLESS